MTTIVGGFASSRSQISVASSGGASGSISATSPPRLDDRRGDERLPVALLAPRGMLEAPDPEARRDVANFGHRYELSISTTSCDSDAFVVNGRFSSSPITHVTTLSKSPVLTTSRTGALALDPLRAGVGLRHLVAVDLRGHRRGQLDDEERVPLRSRPALPGAVLDLRRAPRAGTRPGSPGPGSCFSKSKTTFAEQFSESTPTSVRYIVSRFSIAGLVLGIEACVRRRHALAGSSASTGARTDSSRGRRVRRRSLVVARVAAAPGEGEREHGDGQESLHDDDRTFRARRVSTSPRIEPVDLDDLRAAALAARRPAPTLVGNLERRGDQLHERLVRPTALRRSCDARLPAVAVPSDELRPRRARRDGDANPSR